MFSNFIKKEILSIQKLQVIIFHIYSNKIISKLQSFKHQLTANPKTPYPHMNSMFSNTNFPLHSIPHKSHFTQDDLEATFITDRDDDCYKLESAMTNCPSTVTYIVRKSSQRTFRTPSWQTLSRQLTLDELRRRGVT